MKNKLAINGGTPICKKLKPFNTIGKEELRIVTKVINSGTLSGYFAKKGKENGFLGGKYVQEFEKNICDYLDQIKPKKNSYSELIKFVEDRPGHDFRYAINPEKINNELNWFPKYKFEEGLKKTIQWYVKNQDWSKKILKKAKIILKKK